METKTIECRIRKVSKYLYVVEICKNGVWIDYTTTVPKCDALAAVKRIKSWSV